jgi:putative ABC transport system permease protein
MLATYFPARSAGRRSPLAELRDERGATPTHDGQPRRWPGRLGIGLLALYALAYAVIMSGRLPGSVFMILLPLGTVMLLVAAVLVMPMALPWLSRLVERLLRPALGIEASLAIRQLQHHPTRTTVVVGVLMISVLLSISFGSAILNSLRDIRGWMDHVVAAVDYIVAPTALSGTVLMPVSMPEEYADRISELEGVRRVGKGAMLVSRAAGHRVTIFARSCRPGEHPGFRFVDGDDEKVLQGLRRGEVALGTTLGQRTGLGSGDRVSIETREGDRTFTIAGMVSDYTTGGMVALFDWDHAERLFNIEGAQFLYVTAEPDNRAPVDQQLRAFCDERNLLLLSKKGFATTVDEMAAGVIGSFWVLLALVFVVASLGITNFLTVNVLEQTRELGILRAVAMKRRQIFKMILSEALAMGMIGAIPGLVLGVLVGYAMTNAYYPVVGLRVQYVLEPVLLVGCVAVALAVAVLASLPPARRAGRLTIIRALQYE